MHPFQIQNKVMLLLSFHLQFKRNNGFDKCKVALTLTVQLYVFPAVSKAPLKENLDTASLNFGAEIDRHNGQLDAI